MKVKTEYQTARYTVYSHRRSAKYPERYFIAPAGCKPETAINSALYETDDILAAMAWTNSGQPDTLQKAAESPVER